MSTYIEYEIEDGVTILVEAPEDIDGGIVRASRGDGAIIKAKKRFVEALQDAKAQARLLLKEIAELHVDEAEIKFGLTTASEVGNLAIGKIGMGVNYEVTLKWKKPEIAKL